MLNFFRLDAPISSAPECRGSLNKVVLTSCDPAVQIVWMTIVGVLLGTDYVLCLSRDCDQKSFFDDVQPLFQLYFSIRGLVTNSSVDFMSTLRGDTL